MASRSQFALSSGATATICPRICMPVRKSLRWKAASASRRSAAAGFVTWPGFGLDLGFQLDRRVGEIVALERLVGGDGGDGQQQDERGGKGSANEREHGGSSIPVGRGNPNGAAQDERQNMSRS